MIDRRRGMAEDNNAESSGKRRRPTTIDLKATEIASESVKPGEPAEKAAETASGTPAPEAGAAAESAPPKASSASSSDWLGTASWNERLAAMRRHVAEGAYGRLIGAGAVGAA